MNWNVSPKELRGFVKVEVDVLGSPSLTVPMASVDVKQHLKKKKKTLFIATNQPTMSLFSAR